MAIRITSGIWGAGVTVHENPPRGDAGGRYATRALPKGGEHKSARQIELDGRSIVPAATPSAHVGRSQGPLGVVLQHPSSGLRNDVSLFLKVLHLLEFPP